MTDMTDTGQASDAQAAAIAAAVLPPDWNLRAIVDAVSGGDDAWYDGARLHVPGVTQAALDAAVDAYDHAAAALAAATLAAVARVNAASQAQMDAISAKYPAFEVQTWPDQEREARAWLADATTATPTLGPIAAARGLALDDLAGRVVAKADTYRAAVALCIGRRQKLEDDIAAALARRDLAALDAIAWPG